MLVKILQPGRYDAVVGNPPYITVKDKALNAAYRSFYETCSRKYAMTVPFMELFFQLAKQNADAWPSGWVGQITSNSFMKRRFGVPLIEKFLIRQDLRLIVDTSGAYIPGHGTPTVILVGRNQQPIGPVIRAVLGIRGEPGRPDTPAEGLVWRSIVENVNEPGQDDGWTSTEDIDRKLLAEYPWCLNGGGALQLSAFINKSSTRRLASMTKRAGFFGIIGEDEAMTLPPSVWRRLGLEKLICRQLVFGEDVRDFTIECNLWSLFPYDSDHAIKALGLFPRALATFWSFRTILGARHTFAGETYIEAGRPWYAWHQLPIDVGTSPLALAWASVATHNHFSLDRDSLAFVQSAPVIKLPEGATEDEHLALLGVLNSSTACFWLKQNSHNKGSTVDSAGARTTLVPWENFYEFTGTTLQDYPLPARLPLDRGRSLDALATELGSQTPERLAGESVPTRAVLDSAHLEYDKARAQMISQQEELDWEVYGLYELVNDDLTYHGADLPELALGERAFEIALARRVAAGEQETAWFERHGSTPITQIPPPWPADYRDLVQRRLDLIESDRSIGLLEKPEYKRRWASEPWEKQEERALRNWLLDRLENPRFWFDAQDRPSPVSVGQLADRFSRDPELVGVLTLWAGRPDISVTTSLTRLLQDEAVPFLAAYRYKEAGLRKRADWEATWVLQRREDAGESLPDPIPVPPKYAPIDFTKTSYWQARGKLDVSKERFVLYPNAGRDTDPTPVLGWAGWDHAQQALALSTLIQVREQDGWADDRAIPLIAGLAELQPWVDQWHSEVDPTYGVSLAAFCRDQLTARAQAVGRTLEQLAAWRPVPSKRGRTRKNAGQGAAPTLTGME